MITAVSDAELCDEKRSHTKGFEEEAKKNCLNIAMKRKGYGVWLLEQKAFKTATWETVVPLRASRGREHIGGRSRIWEILLMKNSGFLKSLVKGLRNRRILKLGVKKGDMQSLRKEDLGVMVKTWKQR